MLAVNYLSDILNKSKLRLAMMNHEIEYIIWFVTWFLEKWTSKVSSSALHVLDANVWTYNWNYYDRETVLYKTNQ